MGCVSKEKMSSCGVLLVSTGNGPQAHILPEHGLFGYRDDGIRARERDIKSFQRQQSFSRKESKTVRWADLKRGGGAHLSCPNDHVRSPTPGSSTSSDREQLRSVTSRDLLWTPNSPMGRSEARRNAAAVKPRCRPPPIRSGSRSPAGGCVHSGGVSPRRCVHSRGGMRRAPVRDPFRDPSLLSIPAECVGLPMEVVMRYRAGLRQWPPQVKSRKCVCCSKHATSKDLPIPYPMGKVVIQKLKNVVAKQMPPPKPALRKNATAAPQARKVASDRSTALASLAVPSPTPSRPITPRSNENKTHYRVSPRPINSKRFDHHPHCLGHGFVSKSEIELHDEDCDSVSKQETQSGPSESTHTPEETSTREGEGEREEGVEGEENEDEEDGEEAEGEGEENIAVYCAASHPAVHQQQPQQRVIGGQRFYTAKFQHFEGGKENFHDHLDQHSTDSPRLQQQHFGATTQNFTSGKDSPVQSQHHQQPQVFTDRNRPQLVGGGNLPDNQIVGGNELEDFLVRSRSPLAVVGSAVREMAKECKLVQPEPFSCTKLMARLREIEQETFSVEAALQVAKLRGIELNTEDEMELRKALEEENKVTVTTKGPEPEAPSRPNSARYTKLTKINDPCVAHPGPFLARRKVRKQVNPKWEDMRTMKPTLSDLFDLKERYAQVCSSAPADIDHSVMYVGTERDVEDGELWAQREATCRHAWSSQAVYDSCLYRPDQRDPDCGCNTRVHVRR